MIVARLSWAEVLVGGHAGVMRQVDNLRKGRQDRHGFTGDGFTAHIDGALAEMAVAKALNRYWMPVTEGALYELEGDVGRVQVRSTRHNNGRLIVHQDDPNDALFVLARGPVTWEHGMTFTIPGYIRADAAKRQEWWTDPAGGRPAFFVPNEALRPLAA